MTCDFVLDGLIWHFTKSSSASYPSQSVDYVDAYIKGGSLPLVY